MTIKTWEERTEHRLTKPSIPEHFVHAAMMQEIDELRAENAYLSADRQAMFVELESLKSQVYAAAPRTIGNVGTSCGEYVECSERPDAPHGVDLEASFRAGRTVCVCRSWSAGETA